MIFKRIQIIICFNIIIEFAILGDSKLQGSIKLSKLRIRLANEWDKRSREWQREFPREIWYYDQIISLEGRNHQSQGITNQGITVQQWSSA